LIATNQTTHEQLKKVWSKVSGNPYSRRNFFMNIWKLFKWNIRKSYIENMNSVTLKFNKVKILFLLIGNFLIEKKRQDQDQVLLEKKVFI